MRAQRFAVCVILMAGASLATAQTGPVGGWLIEVIGEPVSPATPSTTVRVSAYFPPNLHAFFGGGFDLVGNDLSASFSQYMLPAPLGPLPPGGYGCFLMAVGPTVPGGITGVGFGQSAIVGCLAHPANPLPIFEGQWTTDDFTPRIVDLETRNTPGFLVWVDTNGHSIDLVPLNQFRHGSAVIQVIPAPSAAAMLLAAMAAGMLRRRRRMNIRM